MQVHSFILSLQAVETFPQDRLCLAGAGRGDDQPKAVEPARLAQAPALFQQTAKQALQDKQNRRSAAPGSATDPPR